MPVFKKHSRKRHAPFTLIEITVAMGILVLLMLMLFQFLAGAQNAWSLSQSNTRIYENARIGMELLQRELKTAVASNRAGRKIPFAVTNNGELEAMVTATNLSTQNSKLCEVSYELSDNVLYRTGIEEGSPNWDFYGDTGNAWTNLTGSSGLPVIRGVENFSVTCYNASGNLLTPNIYTTLPAFVQISLTLFDEDLMDMPDNVRDAKKEQTMRTFTKTVFLGSL